MDTVKIGIIGTGWIAEKMAITLEGMEGVEAYAVASRQLQTACDFADRWGFTRAYGSYEEMLDDSAQTTVNYIKMSSEGVEIRKQGQVNVHMVFEQGKKNKTFYNTPYGTLQMGIAATGLELKESEDDIQMKVDYALDMNEEHVADCYLTVQAQSKDSDEFVL